MHDASLSSPNDSHDHSHAANRFAVIPTADKLKSDPRFTGHGVRIAFLDSGFYPHPDISKRVAAFHDVHDEDRSLHHILEPHGHHWHGTQTVVSCAGDGKLSNGKYKGIAHEAELVLVKVSRSGRIDDASIAAGLEWVIANHEKYDIRVLNMSLGGDRDASTAESRINQLCEQLVSDGVSITVAAGNSSEKCTVPPASSPSVITVGGYSDENKFDRSGFDLYHSSFGQTADGNVKPELIAPAMFIAAPILPNTPDYNRAETLSMLSVAPDHSFFELLLEFWQEAGLAEGIIDGDIDSARREVDDALRRHKIVATHYQHVDGTSFAAPITASVVAQMIEANRSLSPAAIRSILFSTAERLDTPRPIRQGYGIMNARHAIEMAASERHSNEPSSYSAPIRKGDAVQFTFHDDRAESVNIVGDFNNWNGGSHPLKRSMNGLWMTSIDINTSAALRYKFLIDGHRWIEDPSHGMKEEDGLGGFHSILKV